MWHFVGVYAYTEMYFSLCMSHILHLLLLAFNIFSLGMCCDSFSISKNMQSRICHQEIFL